MCAALCLPRQSPPISQQLKFTFSRCQVWAASSVSMALDQPATFSSPHVCRSSAGRRIQNESPGRALDMCSADVVVSQLQWFTFAPNRNQLPEAALQRTSVKQVPLVEHGLASSSCLLARKVSIELSCESVSTHIRSHMAFQHLYTPAAMRSGVVTELVCPPSGHPRFKASHLISKEANINSDGSKQCMSKFDGPLILFGGKDSDKPISSNDESRLHQFGKKMLPGVFMGLCFTCRRRMVR